MKERDTSMSGGRLQWLDALRGIAAVLVLLSHVGPALWPAWQHVNLYVLNLGTTGVIAFFGISGYIIPLSFAAAGSQRVFWMRRILRLVPVAWVTLGLCWMTGIPGTPQTYLLNMTLLPSFFGAPSVLVVFWTLTVELVFYVLISFLMWRKLAHHAWGVMGVLLGLAFVTEGYLPLRTHVLLLFPICTYLSLMWAGTLCVQAVNGQLRWRTAAFLGSLALWCAVWPPDDRQLLIAANSPAAPASIALGALLFVAALVLRTCSWPAVVCWLGRISYSLYLLHLLLVGRVSVASPWLTAILWCGGALVCATIGERLIERPAIALGRHLAPRLGRGHGRSNTPIGNG